MSKNSQTDNINSIDGVAIGRTVIVKRTGEQAVENQSFFSHGEAENNPHRQAPGQTEALPRRRATGQTEVLPRRQSPGQTEALPRRQAPGQTEALPRRQSSGQTEVLPRRQSPGQTEALPRRQSPGQTEKLPRNNEPNGTVKVPDNNESPSSDIEQPGKTLVLPNNENKERKPVSKEERDPRPVGFLVVISGPMIGQYFTLSKDINTVGRNQDSHIHLKDDGYISREHAWITYSPEHRSFTIEKATKTSKPTTLSDGRVVSDSPMPLESGEILTLSHLTKLRFIPFSNQFFDWDFSK